MSADPSPLRLCVIRARYSAFGGAERFVNMALGALTAQGARVTVLARQWTDSDIPAGSFEVVRCDPFYLGATWRDAGFARAVHAELALRRFDLVQSHERMAGVEIYRAGDGVHAAWLSRRQPSQSWIERLGSRLSLHHRYLCRVERKLFEHPALRAVICNSIMVRDEIAERFAIDANKLHVVYNGVDLARFTPLLAATMREAARARLALDGSARVLLFIGSGFARKGLAEALRALAASRCGAAFVVVGSDKHRARYEALARDLGIAEQCRFVGPVEDPAPFYAMADALILPTLYDPFPNAVLEALACGLPVFTSTACGAREVIVDGQNGWLSDPLAVDALALQIRHFQLMHADELVALKGAARVTAERFDVAAMAEKLFALYRQLLAQR